MKDELSLLDFRGLGMKSTLLNKTAMPRAPFKDPSKAPFEASKTLKEILEEGDPKEFVAFIRSNQDNWMVGVAHEYEELDTTDHLMYLSLIKATSAELLPLIKSDSSGSHVPWPLCPSLLEKYQITIPTQFILQWPLEVILDEYFGACYQPSRWAHRYESGFKEAVMAKIKSSTTAEEILDSDAMIITYGLDVTAPGDLTAIFGEEPLERWWKESSEDHLRSWMTGGLADREFSWGEWFVERWGGGLL